MFSTVILCGVVTLLCLSGINLVAYTHRLFRANRSRRLDLSSFVWAIGFLPMAIVTISNIGFGNPILLNVLTFLRNPFLSIDVTIGAFAQIGEISFFMDFVTAILLGSTVAITISRHSACFSPSGSTSSDKTRHNHKRAAASSEERVVVRPYLSYGCYLS